MTFKRPLYGTVRTGPAPSVFPWQVEWVVGKEFRCHIGRVHDDTSLNLDDEFEQSRFSANQQQSIALSPHKMTPRTLNWNVTSMERHAHSAPVRTGSSPIYVQSDRGRIDTPNDTVDEQLGYAVWTESEVRSSSHDTYFILHKVRDDEDTYDQWCVSVVDDVDVTKEDIKLACFKYARGGSASRANLIQLWKSDIVQNAPPAVDECNYPFKGVIDQDTGEFTVSAGTVNGTIVGPVNGTCNGSTYVNVVYSNSGSSIEISMASSSGTPTKLSVCRFSGSVGNGFTVDQLCTSSLWVEKFKCGGGETEYYWNSV